MRELVAPMVAAGPWKTKTGEFESNGSVVWNSVSSPESAGGAENTTAMVCVCTEMFKPSPSSFGYRGYTRVKSHQIIALRVACQQRYAVLLTPSLNVNNARRKW